MADPARSESGGAIRVNGGPFGSALASMLRDALPDERIVQHPGDAGEPCDVLATLLSPVDDVRSALTSDIAWVHVLGVGVDGFPFELLDGRPLTCSRGASAGPIAEWVVAAMLAFEKDLPGIWLSEPPEQWNVARLGGLRDRTLGLVGLGSIGSEVARLASAFGMRIRAVRRDHTRPAPADVEYAASLDDLLAHADHLVLAAPATAETAHLLDERAFAQLRPGVHLVNVSRGSLVDQDALRVALEREVVARAALDVVEPEPLPAGHWLYEHPRVHLSAHVSWSAPETGRNTVACFVDDLRRFRAGAPLDGLVSPGQY